MVVYDPQSKYFHWAKFGQFVFRFLHLQCFVCLEFGRDANWLRFPIAWKSFFNNLKCDISTIDLHVPFSLWHLDVTRWTNLDRRNGNGQESHWKVVNHWWSHGWRCHERIDEKPDYNHLGWIRRRRVKTLAEASSFYTCSKRRQVYENQVRREVVYV